MDSTLVDKYSVTQFSVNSILSIIEMKEIAIPEIQRPFVWNATQVRDLIDSLYNGYPTGYLIIWQNPDIRLKDGTLSAGKKILIDGQQRVTAIMTAVGGYPIVTENFVTKRIKIAFNPLAADDEERFAVQTPVHLKTKHWIADIAELFAPKFSLTKFISQYMAANPQADFAAVESAVTKLQNIKNCQLGAIMLVPQLDISEVTEIFVRINSQGKRLDQSDFVMSKIAADEKYGGRDLRKAIDYFCHLAVAPGFYDQLAADEDFMASEYEPKVRWLKNINDDIYDPEYSDMLRVSFMHMFTRGKLSDLVSLLSGRDFVDRKYKEEIAEQSFAKLKQGVLNFMRQSYFDNFVLAIRSAGFITPKLLNSKLTLDFAYMLYLLLQNTSDFTNIQISKYVKKWFVFTTLTSRYIGSPETQMDHDLRAIETKGFEAFFQENEDAMLSDTFWDIRLVQNLETSSINSPFFNVFNAAQVFFNDRSFLSNSVKVTDLIIVAGDVHHIFPKAYLKQNGFIDKSLYNQVANYIYLDTSVNITIGMRAPEDYLKQALEQCDTHAVSDMKIGTIQNRTEFWQTLSDNCIPHSILSMTARDYPQFLEERRKLMANKIKEYYYAL